MGQTTKTDPGTRPATTSPTPNESQKTVRLSSVPGTAATLPETVVPPLTAPNLSTLSLAALSERYDILGEAGHGNMGNVYKARDRETGETVALKLIKPEIASDQGMMERFKNELLFARKITHKNVCRVYDFNRIGGIACTSMEFVEGESLRSVLNRFGGLPTRKGVDLALQICSGLKEAHAQGIVHRDLKPENVMIDAQGNVKIMDFGIARSMEAGTRLTGAMVGTPAYMAPEQVAGKPVDYRTDIYSLGLMLYEMFTGVAAFQGDTAVAVALKQMREAPAPPHEIDPTIPVYIERVILKCLEKEPEKRYRSIAELEQGLRSTAGTETLLTPVIAAARYPGRSTTSVVRTAPPKAKSRSLSPIVWLLLGAVAVLASLAGARAMKLMKTAERIAPPAEFAAPKPPAFAYRIPVAPPAPKPVEKKAVVAAPVTAPPATQPSVVFPRLEFAQPQKAAQRNGAAAVESPAIYVFVGRFERRERARDAASRVQNLGFPAKVTQRRGLLGQFYVVISGPYAEKRAVDVLQQLQGQGFSKARTVRAPNANPNWRP